MRSQWKRLVWAAVLSCAGFAATFLWYTLTKASHGSNENERALAYVGKTTEDLQRRPATRQLWQNVQTNDALYNGEAIQTSHTGEARIQFADGGRFMDLEPDSLVIIQQNQEGISLDLMQGNVYVAPASSSDGPSGGSLMLNSASGKVDLTKASASLSKVSGKQVEVQVLQGSASVKDKAGHDKPLASQSSSKKSEVTVVAPLPGKTIFVDTEDKESVKFQYSGLPKNLKVSLLVGATRKNLKEVSHLAVTSEGSFRASLPIGKPFWKIVGRDPKTNEIVAESTEYRSDIQPRYAPTVVFPLYNEKIPTTAKSFDMTFKWQKGEETDHIVLEIAKDSSLKDKIVTKDFTTEESFTVPTLLPGDYFWRMSSYYEGSERPLVGKVQKFSITKAVEKELPAKLPVQVSWTVPEDKIQFYLNEPTMNLSWDATHSEDVSTWRLKYFEESEDPSTAQTVQVKDTHSSMVLKKPGRYIASIEGVDKEGQILITSPTRKIAVAPLPLLPAPQLLPLEGNLMAAADGRTELKWEKIDGAKEYVLKISNPQGKILKTLKYEVTQTALKNLMPGEYQVSVATIDEHGRASEAGAPRRLLVPDKSNLKAPTLKKIKVN